MDEINPYQPPQEITTEPSEVTQRLTRKGFLPFVAGVGCYMASMVVWQCVTMREFSLVLPLLGSIVAALFAAFFSIIAYGWLKFRVKKYGFWRQNLVVLFIFGLLFYPVAGMGSLLIAFRLAHVVPSPVAQLLVFVIPLSSLCGYLEFLRFLSQRRSPHHPLP